MDASGMVLIPATEFRMGTPEATLDRIENEQSYKRSWFEDESPQHAVQLDAFRIDRTPVSNAQFEAFTRETGYRSVAEERGFGLVYTREYWTELPGASWGTPGGPASHVEDRPDHPVVHIAAADARAYADWAGKRLPTEAEWELAARGPEFRLWPWGDVWRPELAITAEHHAGRPLADLEAWRGWWVEHAEKTDGRPGTTPVGHFGPEAESPFGLADAAGNVLEWTASSYAPYDPEREYDEVFSMVFGKYAVVRGGSWMHLRYQVRCCERVAADPNGYSSFATGFRCAS